MEAKKHITVSVDAMTWQKLHYIAQQEYRSDSGMVRFLIYQQIRVFEEEQGKIVFPPEKLGL